MNDTTQKLQPIVNGSFNHELSNDEMLAFDFETKKTMAWYLIVSLNFAHSFRDISHKVFTEVPQVYTHDMITPVTVDDILVNSRTDYQQRHKQLLELTSNLYYQQGKQIHEAQKNLGFSGFLKMDARKLVGYIHAGGSWNEFSHLDIAEAVRELDRLAPTFYMRNNPNNGQKKHTWTTSGEYITMLFDYIGKEDREKYLNFYKDHFQRIGQRIKADSIRYELTELNYDACSLELIMWWD